MYQILHLAEVIHGPEDTSVAQVYICHRIWINTVDANLVDEFVETCRWLQALVSIHSKAGLGGNLSKDEISVN